MTLLRNLFWVAMFVVATFFWVVLFEHKIGGFEQGIRIELDNVKKLIGQDIERKPDQSDKVP
jgi:hypothetical protein